MSQVRQTSIQAKPVRTPKAKKGLRRASKERARQLRAYAILRPIYLRSNPYCLMFDECFQSSSDIHHMKGRGGELLCDERWFKASCRTCHDWVETHKNKARELGLILYK